MVFILAYMLFFSELKYKISKTIFILLPVYFCFSFIDYISIYHFEENYLYIFENLIVLVLLTLIELFISEKKGFRVLFTLMCAMDFMLPANMICYIAFNKTKDIFSSIILQIVVLFSILFILVKFVLKYYKSNLNKSNSWRGVYIVPFLCYFTIIFLTIWPMNLIEYPIALPGVILLYILVLITFIMGIRMFTKKGIKQKQDMSLVFLAEYSDRIKNESAKVNDMSLKIDEMSSAMLTIASEILDYLDNNQYDNIRTIVSAIKEDSRLIKVDKKCVNNSINSVLTEVDGYAKKSSINVSYNINVPERIDSIEFEYAVVVERLLNYVVKVCGKFYLKEFSVSIYSSGSWMNFEVRTKVFENEDFQKNDKLIKNIYDEMNYALGLFEVHAFTNKYEVQHSIQFNMGIMIFEFNVRIS